jgi:hypothetical protein
MAKVEIFKTKRPSQRRLIPEAQAKVLVKLGKWSYATAALEGGARVEAKAAPTRRARTAPAEPTATPAEKPKRAAPKAKADDLSAVAFASPAASEAAHAAGLTATAFKRQRKGSERGFTAADVERIAAKQKSAE